MTRKRHAVGVVTTLLCFGLLIAATPLVAQTDNAEIRGTVKDQSGAVLPGVTITLTDLATGYLRSTSTDAHGGYRLSGLRPGSYSVLAELSGFTTTRTDGIKLQVGQHAEYDLVLSVSSVAETVQVVAEVALVDTSKAELAGNVLPKQIESLPQLSRNWLSLSAITPGVRSDGGVPTSGAQSTRRVAVNVDAANTTDQCCAGANGTFSTDSIAEFKVLTNNFDAQYGRSIGTVTNIITKSGTNRFAGSFYGYFRDDKLNAEDPITGEVPHKKLRNIGATLGGPIKRDRAHFFVSFEDQVDENQHIANTPDPRLNEPVDASIKVRPWNARVDFQYNSRHRFFGRYSDTRNANPFWWGSMYAGNSGDNWTIESPQVAFGWTWVKSDRVLNEARVAYLHNRQHITPFELSPRLWFPSAVLYTAYNSPQWWGYDNYQISDTLAITLGSHNLRLGGEFYRIGYVGDFPLNFTGSYYFNSDPADYLNPATYPAPGQYIEGFGDGTYDIKDPVVNAFIQDDWKIASRLTLNLGLRYDAEFGTLRDYSYRTNYGEQVVKHNVNVLSPRAGFAWDVRGNGRTVVRGGAGLFFDKLFLDVTMEQQVLNGQNVWTAVISNPKYGDPFGGKDPNEYRQTPSIRIASDPIDIPKATQLSIGIVQQLTKDIAVQADYVHTESWHEIRDREINVFLDTATGYAKPYYIAGRPDTRFGSINAFESSARSQYDGLQVAVNKRMSHNVMAGVSYILSKSWDETDGAFWGCCDNPFNLAAEWGRSLTDRRHRFVFNGVAELPWGFQVSGLVWAMSGRAYHNNFGGDSNGDGLYLQERFDRATGMTLVRNGNTSDPIFKVDLRASKNFTLYKSLRVEAIAEAFNLFNRANYDPDSYGTVYGTSQYLKPGPSTGELYLPRNIQLGFRIRF